MKFMEKVWGSLGLFEQEEAEDDRAKNEDYDLKAKRISNTNIVNLPTAQNQKQMKVMVVEPFSFDDAQHIADHLKNRKPVVVNFESTDKEIAKRMIDFISGTTYALSGRIQKIGNNIFLCAPNNVDISHSPRDEGLDKGVLPWSSNK